MPTFFVENLQEFTKRMGCDHVAFDHGSSRVYLFENGGIALVDLNDCGPRKPDEFKEPPTEEFTLIRRLRDYWKRRVEEAQRKYNEGTALVQQAMDAAKLGMPYGDLEHNLKLRRDWRRRLHTAQLRFEELDKAYKSRHPQWKFYEQTVKQQHQTDQDIDELLSQYQ